MFERILTRIVIFIFAWILLWSAFGTKAKATEIITSDVGSWSGQYPFQICYAYGGANPCISDGTYFSNEGIGQGDVIFAYTDRYIYKTFSVPQGFSGDTMYLSLDMMTGPRNYNQGTKTEYVIISIYQKNVMGNVVKQDTIGENITNTTMQTFNYTITKNISTTSIEIRISGRDGGYWAGNYGAVIGANTITLNDGATTPTYSSEPTSAQLQKRTDTRNITNSGNAIYIDQAGTNLDLDVVQEGDDNLIAGTSTTSNNLVSATVSGDYNTANLEQKSNNNVLLFGIDGDHNDLIVSQGNHLSDSGGHRAVIDITGNYNSTSLTQYNIGFGSGQFADINISGNDNSITSTQRETDKMLFVDVNGSNNTITTDQKDSGQHFLDITVGSNQIVGVTQQGTGDHAATINMGGYSATLSLNQNSSTDQIYSLEQTCLNSAGCGTTTVNQQ